MSYKERWARSPWVARLVRGGGLVLYLVAVVLMFFLLFLHYRLLSNLRHRIDEMAQVADVAVQAQDVLSSERAMVGQINYAFTFHDEVMMRNGVSQSLPNFKASYYYLIALEGNEDVQMRQDAEALVAATMRLRDLALAGQWEEAEQVREEMVPVIESFEARLEALSIARRRSAGELQTQFNLYMTRAMRSFIIFVLALAGLGVINIFILQRRARGGVMMISQVADAVIRGNLEIEPQFPPFLEGDPMMERVRRSITEVLRALAERFSELEQRIQEEHEALERVLTLVDEGAQMTHLTPEMKRSADLHWRIVMGIARQFDLLHVGLYTLDETGDYLVLRAASSELGQEMLREHYRVRMGEGVIGYVAQQQEIYVGGERSELLRLRDERFPETRAYLVMPLVIRDETIGVLEVRCSRVATFPRHILVVMKAVARRVSFMLDNVRLYEEVERYRRELQRLYGEVLAETWQALLSGMGMLGYHYLDEVGVEPVQQWSPEMEEAIEHDTMLRFWVGEDERIVVPLHARGLTVGVVAAQRRGGWTPQRLETFLKLIAYLETALESAILFTESQMRAARERALGELSSQFAQAFDVEVLLENAVRDLGRRFSLDDVSIFVGPPEEEEEAAEEAQDGEA